MARKIPAWVFWSAGFALVLYGLVSTDLGAWPTGVVDGTYSPTVSTNATWGLAQQIIGGLAFGVVGLILTLNTTNIVGWLMLGVQLGFAFTLFGNSGPVIVLVAGILLIFPSGRIPSRRWRIAVVALAIAAAGVLRDTLWQVYDNYSWLIFMGCVVPVMIASAIRIIRDYRRSAGELHQQLKWLTWALVVGGMVLLISLIPVRYIDDAHDLAGVVLIIGCPIAIGFAITRNRLYEIDRIISRTVAYGLVVGIVASLVALIALAAGTRFDEPWVVAATTLGVAALVNPLRRRVQDWVDRRFNRSKYDHQRVTDLFASSIRDSIADEELIDSWLGVVSEIMQPGRIGIWTRTS